MCTPTSFSSSGCHPCFYSSVLFTAAHPAPWHWFPWQAPHQDFSTDDRDLRSDLVGTSLPGMDSVWEPREHTCNFSFQAAFQLVTYTHILWEKISNCSIEPSVLNETNWKQQLLTIRVGRAETACLKHPGYELWTPESWWDYLVTDGVTRDFCSTQLSPLVQKWKQYYIY